MGIREFLKGTLLSAAPFHADPLGSIVVVRSPGPTARQAPWRPPPLDLEARRPVVAGDRWAENGVGKTWGVGFRIPNLDSVLGRVVCLGSKVM